ncbi:MAG: three-Cys-motif partner protein TcmP [Thermoanaerobaculia bacterium]
MTDDFFEQKREWSRWKHRLLHRYLAQFAGIVGSTHQTVYFIDGFAGEGRYKNPPEDGSPIIAANIAVQTPASRGYSLRCINVEPEHYEELNAATVVYGSTAVDNREGTFRDNLDDVLATIGTHPALFFLDPMGHKGMEWDVVAQIIERARSAITEVLLNFYITRIDVHAGFLHSTAPGAAEFVKRLDALWGTDEWRAIWDSTPVQDERMLRLSDLYMGRLQRAFAAVAPEAAGAVAARYPVRTLDGKLKYFVMYGTRHRRGGRAMSNAVFRVTMEYEDAKAAAKKAAIEARRQLSFLPPETPPTEQEIDDSIVAALIPAIQTMAPRGTPLTLAELEDLLLSGWFGRAVEKHYRRACVRLIEDKKARLQKQKPAKTSVRITIGEHDRIVIT